MLLRGCSNPTMPGKIGHGLSKSHVHRTWCAMHQRCGNSAWPRYDRYGGRGIRVCDRWQSFENFYADMGDHHPGMSLDRINNDGDYEPANCKWSTRIEQANNTSRVRLITAFGETKNMDDWVKDPRCTVSNRTLRHRIHVRGMPPEAAITNPHPIPTGRPRRDITAFGETRTREQWASDPRCSVKAQTIAYRIQKSGMSAEDAIITPSTRNH